MYSCLTYYYRVYCVSYLAVSAVLALLLSLDTIVIAASEAVEAEPHSPVAD